MGVSPTSMILAPANSCMMRPDVTMGEIPSSIKVPGKVHQTYMGLNIPHSCHNVGGNVLCLPDILLHQLGCCLHWSMSAKTVAKCYSFLSPSSFHIYVAGTVNSLQRPHFKVGNVVSNSKFFKKLPRPNKPVCVQPHLYAKNGLQQLAVSNSAVRL